MNLKRLKKNIFACVLGLGLVMGTGSYGWAPTAVYAESGAIYSCTINRSYSHPVTGVVEDSGGEASMATGQGMVEGCVYGSGLMEVTDSGNYYLTIRLGLMDYTSNQSFSVQNVGDSGWMSTSTAITANGSDSNGTTADLCIQVPSENCIVRGSMYVNPMGRDVVFYFYPSNYSEGNSVGMNPAFVTESSGAAQQSADTGTADTGTMETADNTEDPTEESSEEDSNEGTEKTTSENTVTGLQSDGLQVTATPAAEESDEELNSAQGLSLSTAEEQTDDGSNENLMGSGTVSFIVVLTTSITVAGLILITVAALIVWFFRKNWRRWGGEDDDDEY